VASFVPSNALVISSIAVFTSLQEPGFAYVVVVSDCRLLRPGPPPSLKLFMSIAPSSLETDSAASFFSSAAEIFASAASFASEAALAL